MANQNQKIEERLSNLEKRMDSFELQIFKTDEDIVGMVSSLLDEFFTEIVDKETKKIEKEVKDAIAEKYGLKFVTADKYKKEKVGGCICNWNDEKIEAIKQNKKRKRDKNRTGYCDIGEETNFSPY